MTIDSTAAEPTTTTAASEKENDVVVTKKSRKRSSAAISHPSSKVVVTPPRPSSSASGGGDVAPSQVVGIAQLEQSVVASSPPQVLDIGTDDFSIICLSLFNEMTPVELQNFCLKIVGLCDTYNMNDRKLIFALKQGGPFLKRIEKNTKEFKSLIHDHCKPFFAILTIIESNGRLLNLYPLVLLRQKTAVRERDLILLHRRGLWGINPEERERVPFPPLPFPLYLKKRRRRRAQTCTVHGTILLLYLGTRQNYLTANNNNNNNNNIPNALSCSNRISSHGSIISSSSSSSSNSDSLAIVVVVVVVANYLFYY